MHALSALRVMCSLLAVVSPKKSPAECADVTPRPSNDLKTFTYLPETSPAPSIEIGTPLQFNGSYPGQGDVPGQLGWWPKPVYPATDNKPVDLISFVQYNAKEGIVFWAERTAFEVYLAALGPDSTTYAVKLGSPRIETTPTLAGNFTVTEVDNRYLFGWDGDYESWFVCGGPVGDGEYYGLYYGDIPEDDDSCFDPFLLEARYKA
ncbi:hypothetical protein BDZ91DRAFT_767037 [Kalaharituber pfeilii]|nr:hypothetical protein BDZ91DRAFT_767037 [Kalaharituber pfeilii]